MNEKLKEKTREALTSVLPITVIVLMLSVTLVPMEVGTLALFLTGAVLLIVGMGFFQLGAEISMTPLGQGIGGSIVRQKKTWLAVVICFAMGAIITISEPDLQVLANQVAAIPNAVLIWTVAAGVGVFTAVAVLRILYRVPLSKMLLGLYLLLFVVSLFVPNEFLAVAFDAGGVTTGPMTVPFIMALGIGFSAARSDKDSANDSFGLIALCSVGPILMVMLLGIRIGPTLHRAMRPKLSLALSLSLRAAEKPMPSAMIKGTVMGPVVTPPASKATAENSSGTKRTPRTAANTGPAAFWTAARGTKCAAPPRR